VGDAAALAGLSSAVDAVEDLKDPLGPEGARYYLTFPGLDLARDTLLGIDPEGAAVAFAWVWFQEAAGSARAVAWFEAHPERRDLEDLLQHWVDGRAADLLAGRASPGPARVRMHMEEHRTRRCRALEAAGYRHLRTFAEMHRSLTGDLPAPPPLPPGVVVLPWAPEWDEPTRHAANDAFSLHWDSLPLDAEQWKERVTGDSIFRPDLSFVAVHGSEVVSLCLAAVDPEHNERAGLEEVWVERLATRPGWQRRGLATALLADCLQAAASAGMTRAGLTADEASATQAAALYERLGFAATRRTRAYVKHLAGPEDRPTADKGEPRPAALG